MSRDTDFAAARLAASHTSLTDMTPISATLTTGYLVNQNDAGPWIPYPKGPNNAYVEFFLDSGGSSGATVVLEAYNMQSSQPQVLFTTTALTGASTSDSQVVQSHPAFIRVRRTDANATGNVSATVCFG
jgi:hypothetical protein